MCWIAWRFSFFLSSDRAEWRKAVVDLSIRKHYKIHPETLYRHPSPLNAEIIRKAGFLYRDTVEVFVEILGQYWEISSFLKRYGLGIRRLHVNTLPVNITKTNVFLSWQSRRPRSWSARLDCLFTSFYIPDHSEQTARLGVFVGALWDNGRWLTFTVRQRM